MEAFVNEVLMAYGDWRFLILTTVLLVVGLVFLKGYKKRFIIPALILTVVILNPLFYNLWYKFNDRSYWRMMWMVPIIPICVIVPAFFIEKCKKDIVKVGVLFLTTAVMILCGSFIYDGSREVFAAANNPEKLPDDVVAVGEALLAIDDEPYVATDPSLSVYLRQYSGRIKSVYGRDFKWQNSDPNLADRVYTNLSSPEGNYKIIAQDMLNNDYKYLVASNREERRRQKIDNAGFKFLEQVGEYGIYQVTGKKTEIRTYNDLHQVTSVTYVDDDGNPCTIDDGYSKVQYIYLDKNKEPLAYFYDQSENQIIMGSGVFHDFLNGVMNEEIVLFIAVKDEASRGMNEIIINDLHSLGVKTDLRGKYRQSYYAIISKDSVIERLSDDKISYHGKIGNTDYEIASAGKTVGDYSSIRINGIEYSKNGRGMNIVVFNTEDGAVIDAFSIDTFLWLMQIDR